MLRSCALALLVALAGCMTVHLTPMRLRSGIPGVIEVTFRKIDGDLIVLDVHNASPDSIVIQRDNITLREPGGGVRTRMQGGVSRAYVVPPGGSHAVNLRFDLARLPVGDTVQLDFSGAFLAGAGADVPVPPIYLSVQ